MKKWLIFAVLVAAAVVLSDRSEGMEEPENKKGSDGKPRTARGDNTWWGRTHGDKEWGKKISAQWGHDNKLRLDPKTLKKKYDKKGKEIKISKKGREKSKNRMAGGFGGGGDFSASPAPATGAPVDEVEESTLLASGEPAASPNSLQ